MSWLKENGSLELPAPRLSFPRRRESGLYWNYVYILANKPHGVLYVGVTGDLPKRVYEHKNKLVDGFTKKYNVDRFVYFESAGEIEAAITREKQIKKWYREWKMNLIEALNPDWTDLYGSILGQDSRLRGNDSYQDNSYHG